MRISPPTVPNPFRQYTAATGVMHTLVDNTGAFAFFMVGILEPGHSCE